MKSDDFFSDQELADTAFRLLACSSLYSYVAVAKRASEQANVYARLRSDPGMAGVLVNRARELWKQLLSTTGQRDIAEVELAMLLPMLAHAATRDVDALLRALLLVEKPHAAWISALAKRLYADRSVNLDLTLTDTLFSRLPRLARNSAETNERQLIPRRVDLTCSLVQASQGEWVWE